MKQWYALYVPLYSYTQAYMALFYIIDFWKIKLIIRA